MDEVVTWLKAVRNSQYLGGASLTLFCFDYAITLDQEIQLFWSGRWTISRVLFLLNRYLPPIPSLLVLLVFNTPGYPSDNVCINLIRASYGFSVFNALIFQAVLAIRIWYLFHSVLVRAFVSLCYAGCALSTALIVGLVLFEDPFLAPRVVPVGCPRPQESRPWAIFLPSVGMHTIFYAMTLYKAMSAGHSTPVMKRITRDGGMYYLVFAVTVGVATFGGMTSNLTVQLPVLYSNFAIVITSIATARIMLSIHSLAAELRTDPRWLLNDVELSRVRWKRGTHERELVVDVDSEYPMSP